MSFPLPLSAPPRRRVRREVPRGALLAAVLTLLAATLGMGAVLWPGPTLLTTLGLLVVATMLVRLEWAVLVVVLAAPFLAHPALVETRLAAGLVVVMTGSWVVHRSRGGRVVGHSPSRLLLAALALVSVLTLSATVHDNGSTGRDYLLAWLTVLTAMVVLVEAMRSVIAPVTVVRAYVGGAAASSVLGMVALASASARSWLAAGDVDLDLWTFHLLAAAPLALALRYVSRRQWWCDLALVLVVLGLVSTTTWAAIAGLVVMLVTAVGARMISLRVAVTVAVVVATAITFVHLALPVAWGTNDPVQNGLHSHSWAERQEAWGVAVEMTKESPALGLGPGSFTLLQQDFRTIADSEVGPTLTSPHSTYLAVSAQVGLLGLAVVLVLLLGSLRAAWRRYRQDESAIAAGAAVGLVGALVAGLAVSVQLSLSLWLLVALAAVLARPPEEHRLPASLVRLREPPERARQG